jgi:phosphoribosylamine--glycine ligase
MNQEPDTPMKKLTILLLGSGGREHSLAWRMAQSEFVERLYCAPGNPGIEAVAELRSCNIDVPHEVVALAQELAAELVVIGPEVPLANGVSDALRDAGFAVFGPSQRAAQLEWDKAFSKEFMLRHDIPTAAAKTFTTEKLEEGCAFLDGSQFPIVLKANGLAAGKGVVIAENSAEARTTLEAMLSGAAFGSAGECVVVEEFLQGQEASVFVITDGDGYVVLAPSQDHKRVGDGDIGPNTGGMGAYAPAPIVTEALMQKILTTIVEPTLAGMRSEGSPYSGCLFVGLMIDGDRLNVVEFNSRFGDPETQVILPLLATDLVELLYRAATGGIISGQNVVADGSAVCVVMTAAGYPGNYEKGKAITGIDRAEGLGDVVVFHAGTRRDGEQLVSNGGRILGVTAISSTNDLESTIERAYQGVREISFEGAHFRRDIGTKALVL